MNRTLRIATCQFQVGMIASWDAFEKKLDLMLGEAKRGGADLALLPEYFSMELATMFGTAVRESLPKQLEALQPWIRKFRLYVTDRARRFRMAIVAGSIPVRDDDGRYRNRCFIATPDGREFVQDKHRMTRFEREQWGISGGEGHALFEVKGVQCAVAICYDCEFPNVVREKVDLGAELILVPSCTDSFAGYHRVRVGAQARALENQCYVAVAHTVGALAQSPAIDENHGVAAIYGPPDRGFPDDGIVAQGTLDAAQWVFADLDFALIEHVRRDGQVLNHRDW
ncbi:MAG: carbon-nitrogen hydrolase family protein [Xanthomonadales bacterium]|nr:carbon-nitrogen hydrolase family protein [Xanthomonadales bacterium]